MFESRRSALKLRTTLNMLARGGGRREEKEKEKIEEKEAEVVERAGGAKRRGEVMGASGWSLCVCQAASVTPGSCQSERHQHLAARLLAAPPTPPQPPQPNTPAVLSSIHT